MKASEAFDLAKRSYEEMNIENYMSEIYERIRIVSLTGSIYTSLKDIFDKNHISMESVAANKIEKELTDNGYDCDPGCGCFDISWPCL